MVEILNGYLYNIQKQFLKVFGSFAIESLCFGKTRINN